ncbi:hypothetical protein ACOTTU_17065 [Roseobacter sp. EG26]|uniref:hypothetical protein n=1 Tax=Roseobacter sp. EG26 TaxID=3412477 RepID=UPI003CE54D7C
MKNKDTMTAKAFERARPHTGDRFDSAENEALDILTDNGDGSEKEVEEINREAVQAMNRIWKRYFGVSYNP